MSVGYKYGMPLNTAARKHLESRGYLIIPPGDASPLGELVRAAVDYHEHNGDALEPHDESALRLLDAGEAAAEDPAIRAWAAKEKP